MNLVQGNIEGIAKLDPSVDTVACEEAYSQMRLEALVNEFGDAYAITSKNDRITVTRRSTGEVVLTGRAITLVPELVPVKEDRTPVPQPRDEQLIARIEPQNRLAVWTVGDRSPAPKDLSSNPSPSASLFASSEAASSRLAHSAPQSKPAQSIVRPIPTIAYVGRIAPHSQTILRLPPAARNF